MTHIRCSRSLLLAVALSIACAVHADQDVSQLGLDELLKVEAEGASRHSQPLAETPSTVTVLDAEDIRRHGFRDLGEALQAARGVYTTHDRAYSYLGVRGFGRPGDYNTRVVLLQDGVRLNDPVYDQAMVGHEAPLEMEWIKRLEFVPGPSSASYGGNALFGIANAVTWTGADLAGAKLSLNAGADGLRRVGLLTGGVTAAGLDWVAGISSYRSRGADLYFKEFDQPGVGDGIAHRLDGERYVKGLLKAAWGGWQASLNFVAREKDIPTAYYGTLFDAPGNFAHDAQTHLSLGHEMALDDDLIQRARLHAGYARYTGEYPFEAQLNRDEMRAGWWDAEYQLHYSGWRDHRVLLGAEMRRGYRLEQRNFDVTPAALLFEDRHGSRGVAAYAQDEWRLAPEWLVNLGLRADRQEYAPTIVSPRFALIHRPTSALVLKYLVGRAFRAPNDYELHYHDGMVTQKPNPDLKPERLASHELAADWTVTPTLRLGVGRYRYVLRDLIEQTTDVDGLAVFRNRAPMRAQGWETEIEALLGGGWRLRGSLTWQTVSGTGGEPFNSPRRLGRLLLDGPLPWAGWTLGLNLGAMSRRASLLATAPGHATGNLVLRRALDKRGGALSLGIYNLSNQPIFDPAAKEYAQDLLAGDGRQWRLTWDIGF